MSMASKSRYRTNNYCIVYSLYLRDRWSDKKQQFYWVDVNTNYTLTRTVLLLNARIIYRNNVGYYSFLRNAICPLDKMIYPQLTIQIPILHMVYLLNIHWTKKVKDHIFEMLPKKIWMQFWPFVFSIFSSRYLQYSNVTCRPVHFMGKWLHEWILIQGQKQSVSTCLQSWLWCLLKDICEVFDNCRHSTDISHDGASFNR